MTNPTSNAIFYGRVSTDRQDTYEQQLAEAQRFCASTEGLALDPGAVFYESGVTGQYFAHGAYQRMLDHLQEHPSVRFIIVRDLSRFGRAGHRLMEVERHRLETEFGVTLLSAAEPFLNPPVGLPGRDRWGNPRRDPMETGRVITQAAIDQANLEFRRTIGTNSRAAVLEAYQAGRAHGGAAPLFFTAVPTSGRNRKGEICYRLEPDPSTRHLHQEMFERVLAGESLNEVSRWLESQGVVSRGRQLRGGQFQGGSGQRLNKSTLRYRLRDAKFIGALVYNRYWPKGPDNPTGRRERPREYWIVVDGYCEATVEPAVFHRVQALLDGRDSRREPPAALLTGMIRCGLCGRPLTVVRNRWGASYRCSGRKHGNGCRATEVRVEALEAAFQRLLLGDYFQPQFLAPFFRLQDAAGIMRAAASLRQWWEGESRSGRRRLLRAAFIRISFSRRSREDPGQLDLQPRPPTAPESAALAALLYEKTRRAA